MTVHSDTRVATAAAVLFATPLVLAYLFLAWAHETAPQIAALGMPSALAIPMLATARVAPIWHLLVVLASGVALVVTAANVERIGKLWSEDYRKYIRNGWRLGLRVGILLLLAQMLIWGLRQQISARPIGTPPYHVAVLLDWLVWLRQQGFLAGPGGDQTMLLQALWVTQLLLLVAMLIVAIFVVIRSLAPSIVYRVTHFGFALAPKGDSSAAEPGRGVKTIWHVSSTNWRCLGPDAIWISPVVRGLIPVALARRERVLPLALYEDTLTVAVCGRVSKERARLLGSLFDHPLYVLIVSENDLVEAIDRQYGSAGVPPAGTSQQESDL